MGLYHVCDLRSNNNLECCEEQENHCPQKGHGLDGDDVGHKTAANDRQSRAKDMATQRTHKHSHTILSGGQYNCSNLRSISPFGYEDHSEHLS